MTAPIVNTTENLIPLPKRPGQLKELQSIINSQSQPMVLITGQQGTGKTTLINDFVAQVQVTNRIVRLQGDKQLQPNHLTQLLSHHWHIDINADEKNTYRKQLDQILLDLAASERNSILIADGAHLLPLSTLAALSHLATKQEGNSIKLHLILVGEPELQKKVNTLQSNVPPNIVINPLTRKETAQYIRYCLARMNKGIGFSPDTKVVERIYEQSKGVPLSISQFTQEWLDTHLSKMDPSEVGEKIETVTLARLKAAQSTEAAGATNFWQRHAVKSIAASGIAVLAFGMWFLNHHVHQQMRPLQVAEAGVYIPARIQAQSTRGAKAQSQAESPVALAQADTTSITTHHTIDKSDKVVAAASTIDKTHVVNHAAGANSVFGVHIAKTSTVIVKPVVKVVNKPHSSYYALQLFAGDSKKYVENFVHHYKLESQVHIEKISQKDKSWYVAAYGKYATAKDAVKAMKTSKKPLKGLSPWVRHFDNS